MNDELFLQNAGILSERLNTYPAKLLPYLNYLCFEGNNIVSLINLLKETGVTIKLIEAERLGTLTTEECFLLKDMAIYLANNNREIS